jgi:hypothetical protein
MKTIFQVIAIAMIIAFSTQAEAQRNYTTAAGVRLGSYTFTNLSLKHFLTDQGAVEVTTGLRSFGLFGFRRTRIDVGAIYQHHFPLEVDIPGTLQWYIGVGGNLGFYSGFETGLEISIMGGGGVDYKFDDLPLNVSIDLYLGPFFGLYQGIGTRTGGLAVRYTIK